MATAFRFATRVERWRIVPLETPRVPRRCARCDETRSFRSTGRFRVNAQKRRLDVWLVHRCERCDETWNAPVLERVAAREIAGADLDAYLRNDADTARCHAFAVRGAAPDDGSACRVERTLEVAPPLPGEGLDARIELAAPVAVRLDRLLARELGVSRARVAEWHACGRLRLDPEPAGGLRGRVRDGQRVLLAPTAPGDAAAPLC